MINFFYKKLLFCFTNFFLSYKMQVRTKEICSIQKNMKGEMNGIHILEDCGKETSSEKTSG